MMSPEEFGKIAEAANNGEAVSPEDIQKLIQAVRRMDLLVVIFQNSLELMSENTYAAMPVLAEQVMQRCGRTEQKTKKSIAEIAAKSVAACDDSLQSYMTTAMFQAAEFLGLSLEEFLGMPQEEASSSSSSEEPSA